MESVLDDVEGVAERPVQFGSTAGVEMANRLRIQGRDRNGRF
jgi:hypothetical protein